MRRIFKWGLFLLLHVRLHFWDRRGGIVGGDWVLFIDGEGEGGWEYVLAKSITVLNFVIERISHKNIYETRLG